MSAWSNNLSPSFTSDIMEIVERSGDITEDLDSLMTVYSPRMSHYLMVTPENAVLIEFDEEAPVWQGVDFVPVMDNQKYAIQEYEGKLVVDYGGGEVDLEFTHMLTGDVSKLYSSLSEHLPSQIRETSRQSDLPPGHSAREIPEEGLVSKMPLCCSARILGNGRFCDVRGIFPANLLTDPNDDQDGIIISKITNQITALIHGTVSDLATYRIVAYSSIIDRFKDQKISVPYVYLSKEDGVLREPFFLNFSKKVENELGLAEGTSAGIFRDDDNLFITLGIKNKGTLASYLLRLPFDSLKDSNDRIASSRISTSLRKYIGISRDGTKISLSSVASRMKEWGKSNSRVMVGIRYQMMCGEILGIMPNKPGKYSMRFHNQTAQVLVQLIPLLIHLSIAKFDPDLRGELKRRKTEKSPIKRRSRVRPQRSRVLDWGTDKIRYISIGSNSNGISKHWVSPHYRKMKLKNPKTIEEYRKKGWLLTHEENGIHGLRVVKAHFRGVGGIGSWDGNYRFGKKPSYYSLKAIRWLKSIEKNEGIVIQHAETKEGELRIPNGDSWIQVDGFCQETGTVYEFHGDVYHGNPEKFEPHEKCHPFRKDTTAQELYEKTMEKENHIISTGLKLVVMWESQWDLIEKKEYQKSTNGLQI